MTDPIGHLGGGDAEGRVPIRFDGDERATRAGIAADGLAIGSVGERGPIVSSTFVVPDENGAPLVSIHPDGRIDLADPDRLDDAARAFWDAVRRVTGWEDHT